MCDADWVLKTGGLGGDGWTEQQAEQAASECSLQKTRVAKGLPGQGVKCCVCLLCVSVVCLTVYAVLCVCECASVSS